MRSMSHEQEWPEIHCTEESKRDSSFYITLGLNSSNYIYIYIYICIHLTDGIPSTEIASRARKLHY